MKERSGDASGVVARVSVLQVGTEIITPRGCFSALVLISNASTNAVDLTLPGTSLAPALHKPGELCLLPPGTCAKQKPLSSGKVIHYEIPQQSLREFSIRHALEEIDTLETPHFAHDPILHLLSRAVGPIVDKRESYTSEFAEHFTLSLYGHLFERYGTKSKGQETFFGGLSPRHRRVIEDALQSLADPCLCIEMLSKRCGLSSRQFARAFRQTFGTPFHRYLMNARVNQAKLLLRETTMPLEGIARSVGYADQATFTESFTRTVGGPPGRYRRRYSS